MSTELDPAVSTASTDGVAAAVAAPPAESAPAAPRVAESSEPMTAPGPVKAAWAIARKELNIYFTTPLAYVLLGLFLGVMGFFFVIQVQAFIQYTQSAQQMMQFNPQVMDQLNFTDVIFTPLTGLSAQLLVFIAPFLTMRLVAEEKRQNSIQLLMTAPVGSTGIVLGKFFASALVVLVTIALTTAYPLLLNLVAEGGGVEWQTVATAYFGVFLAGCSFMAIGLFISSLTDSQIVAGVVTLILLVLLLVVGGAAQFGNVDGVLKDLADWVSLRNHLSSFMRGIISLADVTYFLSIIGLGLFLTRTSIERMRW